jgi:glycosidase
VILPFLAPQAEVVAHTFSVTLDRPATQVYLAGTFNNWDKRATKMALGSDGRTYSTTVRLQPGRHQYKFVLDEDTWITDPKGISEADGNGNTNSVLLILPRDYVKDASPSDSEIAVSALQHSTESPYFNYDRGRLTVSLRARPNDLSRVELILEGNRRVPTRFEKIDDLYGRYVVSIPWDRKKDFNYAFFVLSGYRAGVFGPTGLGAPDNMRNAPLFKVTKNYQPFEVPKWVEGSVLYQIFPDRFENGDKSNDPKDVEPWDAQPQYFNRYGGDVAGVRKRIGHFSALGINCVYFNPIFKAPSNHRYDATDYLTLDPTFGTNDDFARLTRELKAKGIKTVLDGVYNHTAVDFFAFADVREKGKASPYADWYTIHSFPVQVKENPNYVAWFNFPSMPKLNLSNPETRNYMLGIPQFWDQKAEIAGWRLDVANEVQMDFWRDFRKVVKGIDKDNWIVGEVWGDGSPWLKGDQWDSVMNYRFRGAVLGFVGKDGSGRPSEFLNGLMSVYNSYAPQVSRNMMNLLGSHDTPRILTLCGGDRDLAKLAAVVQFTWVGAPSIYYGDELGMEGDKDPDNRQGMRWDLATPQNDFLALYRRLVKTRRESRVLQSGDPHPLFADDVQGTLAYARVLDKDFALVALNRSGETREVAVPLAGLPARRSMFTDALTGKTLRVSPKGHLLVSLPPKSAAVLIPR